jgi:hypothetical protein
MIDWVGQSRAASRILKSSDRLRLEYFEPRGLYAPESHQKRNLSNIARVIRVLKAPIRDFVDLLPTKWNEFGERTDRTRSTTGETDPSEERRL